MRLVICLLFGELIRRVGVLFAIANHLDIFNTAFLFAVAGLAGTFIITGILEKKAQMEVRKNGSTILRVLDAYVLCLRWNGHRRVVI